MTPTLHNRYSADGEYIFTVSEINGQVRDLLERHFGQVMIRGELSNLSTPASGHCYFTLKDHRGAIRCAFFRGQQHRGLAFNPADGDHVVVYATLSVYAERGDYQLIVSRMEREGDGELQRQFELLKKQLSEAGLFDSAHKKPLPVLPKRIGIITSATGAALQDALHVLQRRSPMIPVSVYDSAVQGDKAPKQLISALSSANQQACCDVLLLIRGGGAAEDLWAFNDPELAKAIFASQIPVVSGVGHEIDVTIADFVADRRAPTPSAAAEITAPDQQQLLTTALKHYEHLVHAMKNTLKYQHQRLQNLRQQLRHPRHIVMMRQQQCDHIYVQLEKLIHNTCEKYKIRLLRLDYHLKTNHPGRALATQQTHLNTLKKQLLQQIASIVTHQQHRIAQIAAKLDIISPLATLSRGYAIAIDDKNHVIKSAEDTAVGNKINVTLSRGVIECEVKKLKAK